MNPPNSDGKGPTPPSGASGPRPDAGKPDASKPNFGKPDPAKPDLTKTDPVKSDPAKPASPQPVSVPQAERPDLTKPAISPIPSAAKPGESKAPDAKPDFKPDASKAEPGIGEPTKAEPAKIEPAKIEPAKVEPAKPSASTFDAGRTAGAKPDLSKVEPSKPDSLKPDVSKSDAFKAGSPGSTTAGTTPPLGGASAPRNEPPRTDPPRTGASTGNPQSPPQKSAITDGPIIDLKAKRLPDPAETAKAGAATPSSTTKPSGSGTFTPSATPTQGTDKAASGADAKSSGSTTPKIAPSAPAATEAARKGLGFGSVATAGLLGGVLGAGLLFAVERSGALGGGDDARLAALDQKIAALAPKDAIAALDKRVGANEAALKPLPEAIRSADAAAKDALQKAAATQAAPPAEGSAPAAAALPTALIARLDGLDQRVAALQEEPGRDQSGNAAVTALGPQALAALDDRLKAVEGKVDAPAKGDGADAVAALKRDLETRTTANSEADEALGQKLAALQQSLEARVKAATEAVQTATQASQQAVDANKAQAAETAKGLDRQFQAQAEKIAGLDQAVASRAEVSTVQAGLRIVAADRIVTALNTGAPYADALAALRSFEPGDPTRLSAVAAFAEKGAPTARSLAAEFRPIVEKIAASRRAAQAKTVAETGDIKQRLMSMAGSIVQVRKVDAPAAPGETATDDATPKVQDALDRGAIGEAAKAFAALPESARAQAGEFGTKLTSRASAGEAAQVLLSDAFKALPSTGAAR